MTIDHDKLVAFLQLRCEGAMTEAVYELRRLGELSQKVAADLTDPAERSSALSWWAEHSQGFAYIARDAERLMVQAKTYRDVIRTIAPETEREDER